MLTELPNAKAPAVFLIAQFAMQMSPLAWVKRTVAVADDEVISVSPKSVMPVPVELITPD